ncbi:hypothetical protein [Microlunatus flavus]|uniref:DUF4352 domain-containing protein n=1 Tax=Microlunatus flavus TaxID=1036181 RepID=A0A1H9AVK4_9ACTN|nr:hypothetical protein [Microlunatus flavus]SEP80832.1 hypothetical protein SAMN05421756_101749 [Microlunatus flavus]
MSWTVSRTRLASVVLAVVLVTLAAVAYRVTDSESRYELVPAPLDTDVSYESGSLRVSDVRVADQIQLGRAFLRTQGMFVVVHVTLSASGRDSLLISDTRVLSSSGTTYASALSLGQVTKAEPGFETSRDYVFEVDPTRIDDLTLEVWNVGVLAAYYERTRTPLGITAGNAARWAEAGRGRTVPVPTDEVTRALP